MRRFADRVTFAVQHEQEGYGHAVYQTKNFAAGEMVLLGLGDHLFRGKPVSPYRELAEMANVSQGKSVSAVNRITAGELKGYGTIAGKRRAENPRLIDVSLIIEKPAVAVAREKLHVNDLPADTWLGWFGMHLLAPGIYEILGEMIRDNVRDNGEFQLTRAQEIQRQREGYLALEMTSPSVSTSVCRTISFAAFFKKGIFYPFKTLGCCVVKLSPGWGSYRFLGVIYVNRLKS